MRPETAVSCSRWAGPTLRDPWEAPDDGASTAELAMSVLLVSDEPALRRAVRDQLQHRGLAVAVAGAAAEVDVAIARQSFAVVVLDVAHPAKSGLDVLDRLGAANSTAHVIVLSGSGEEADRLHALQRGADDVIVKPFSRSELTERVLAVQRRPDPAAAGLLRRGHLHIDLEARQVCSGGIAVELTPKEFDLLAYLATRPGRAFSREELLNAVWGSTSEWQQAATVTEHIRRLRNKLELDPTSPKVFTTVRGAGYRLDDPRPADHADRHTGVVAEVLDAPARNLRVDGSAGDGADAGRLAAGRDGAEPEVVVALLRGLLRVRSAPAAVDLLQQTIRGMGGALVPASEASVEALPQDVSLGEGAPVLVEVEGSTDARAQLEQLLPRLVEDTRQIVDLLRSTERLAEDAAGDQRTGLYRSPRH
jgi:two-component system phosphate regulon response regulator PhoB